MSEHEPGMGEPTTDDGRRRWFALYVLCLASLMIVLDVTIVNVALPSIRGDLGFSQTSLAWVVNAYLLTYGGFLLLGGRLGDLFGARRLFLAGITLFTLASLACGLANSQGLLVGARAVQGLGGAVASAVSLSLMMNLFTEPADRAKAMGVFGFVAAGGGSIGVLLGGILTDALDWHWIFLVNFPIGVLVFGLSLRLLPSARGAAKRGRLDIGGAFTVTAALMFAVYAIVNGNQERWSSARTLGLLGGAAALFALFLAIEARVRAPLAPLGLFRLRNLPIATGLLLAAVGLLLFVRAPVDGTFIVDVLPSMILLGFGAGMAFNPVLLAAMSDVKPEESGLASGVVNTAFLMGGALGLAILASLASSRTDTLLASGDGRLTALTGGYHVACLVGAAFAVAAAAVGAVLLRTRAQAPAHEGVESIGAPAAAECS